MKLTNLAIFSPLFNRFMLEGMHKLHEVLRHSPLHNRYWICGGVLLGYIREGGIIKHDRDVDFHYWRDDRDKFESAVQLLIDAGFKPKYRWRNNAGETTEHVLTYKSIQFEFFEAHRAGNNTRWFTYAGSIKHERMSVEILNETPGCELEEFEFLNKTWLKPSDHEGYLDAVYGDWRKPDSSYEFYKDSKAIISRTPLAGKTTW